MITGPSMFHFCLFEVIIIQANEKQPVIIVLSKKIQTISLHKGRPRRASQT